MTERRHRTSIASDGLSAEIDPLGAQLFALRDAEGRDLLWDGDPGVWTGRAPILFPIVGMLSHGRYRLDGQVRHLGKHGFARHKLFERIVLSPTSATFQLRPDEETLESYPFQFTLDITFTVQDASLNLTAALRNLDAKTLPASFGFHPALRWPLPYGQPRADHTIHFEHAEPAPIRRINAEGLLKTETFASPVIGKDLILKDELFVDDALMFDQLNSRRARYGASKGPHIDISFPDTRYLGVWTKPGAHFICIEPWHGINDPQGFEGDFRSKPGVFEVAPGAIFKMTMSISLRHPL